jgi:DNA-binding FrmR family transcriptional regulator
MEKGHHSELVGYLRQQVDAIHQTILVLEVPGSSIQIIKHIRQIQVRLQIVNVQLIDHYLEACLATAAQTNREQIFDEVGAVYCLFRKIMRKAE